MNVNSVTITINGYDNDAMVNDRTGETIRILKGLVERLESGDGIVSNFEGLRLMDSNGNTVGEVEVDWDDEEAGEYDWELEQDRMLEAQEREDFCETDEAYGCYGGDEF